MQVRDFCRVGARGSFLVHSVGAWGSLLVHSVGARGSLLIHSRSALGWKTTVEPPPLPG